MIRIAHFGSYNSNIGDNVALKVVRDTIERESNVEVEWVKVKLSSFENLPISTVVKYFKSLNNNCSALIIGGGGLFEGGPYSDRPSGWKLPFTKKVLSEIKIPIFIFGVGINYFRKIPGFSADGHRSMIDLLSASELISLRNDGSMDSAEALLKENKEIFNKISEIPDPGLILPIHLHKDRIHDCSINKGVFQQAFNSGRHVNDGRFENSENMYKVFSFAALTGIPLLPHTQKDFQWFSGLSSVSKEYLQRNLTIDRVYDFIKNYHKFDYCIPMRGHGQLISAGVNCPFISLSTQDKVRDFANRNGFREYNVDIQSPNWHSLLRRKMSLLASDKDYLEEWYDIRDKNIEKWNEQFGSFSKEVAKRLS